MCTVFVEFTSPPPTHRPPNPFSEGQTQVVCGDVGYVWMRGVGVKLGHGKSKQSSSSKAHSDRGDEQSCWWIHEITAFLGDEERMYLRVVLSSRAAHANIKWRFTDLHSWHRVTSDLGQTEFAKHLDLLRRVFTDTTALSGFEFPWDLSLFWLRTWDAGCRIRWALVHFKARRRSTALLVLLHHCCSVPLT